MSTESHKDHLSQTILGFVIWSLLPTAPACVCVACVSMCERESVYVLVSVCATVWKSESVYLCAFVSICMPLPMYQCMHTCVFVSTSISTHVRFSPLRMHFHIPKAFRKVCRSPGHLIRPTSWARRCNQTLLARLLGNGAPDLVPMAFSRPGYRLANGGYCFISVDLKREMNHSIIWFFFSFYFFIFENVKGRGIIVPLLVFNISLSLRNWNRKK